jgi:IS4 transposase
MDFPKVFEAFVQQSPVPVMARGILEYALPPARIDELFRKHSVRQYEDELLFSTVFEILSLAVAGSRRSVNASYQSLREKTQVSVISLYNKLKGTELLVSQALVRETARRLGPAVDQLRAPRAELLPGLRIKILDGNHLTGTQHRLEEARRLNGQPLPGQALVILDPRRMLMIDVFPCEDAYTQERRLLDDVLATLEADDCWVADRNFCTTDFLFGVTRGHACFVIRQHASTLNGKRLLGERRFVGPCEGGRIFEQPLEIDDPTSGTTLVVRRITVVLDEPTRTGEEELHLLSNIPRRQANALQIATTYRSRWMIENAFQELEQALASEINTLCYPKAALLCFSVGIVMYNMLSALKSAIEAVHSQAPALSGYYLAEESAAIYGGMMIAIAPRIWTKTIGPLTSRQLANMLRQLAAHVNPIRFRKNVRGPKKPPPPRTGGIREKHFSTARLLASRKK